VALILAAIVVAEAPEASGRNNPPLRSTETFTLNIYGSYLSSACGVEVVATLTATQRRNVYLGANEASPATEITTYEGEITWLARASGATYSDNLNSTLTIAYPQGIEIWKPARVTVVGRNGGTFPIGGGPAGTGILVYNATVYASYEGFPYWFTDGDPVYQLGSFDLTTRRICVTHGGRRAGAGRGRRAADRCGSGRPSSAGRAGGAAPSAAASGRPPGWRA
jgi:hypothetical protein